MFAAIVTQTAFCLSHAVWFGSDHPGLYTTLIFVLSAVTDFLDGYLARSMVRKHAGNRLSRHHLALVTGLLCSLASTDQYLQERRAPVQPSEHSLTQWLTN